MVLMEGGYQICCFDFGNDYYKDFDGNVLFFEKVGEILVIQCFYGCCIDWEKFYKIVEIYFIFVVNNFGIIVLQVNDFRSSDKKIFGNFYQYVF